MSTIFYFFLLLFEHQNIFSENSINKRYTPDGMYLSFSPFSKAAHVLGYSQSTVSFQIRQLEEELDCMLFERINYTISLIEKGTELFAYAQQIRHLTDEFKQNIKDSCELSGHIHIVTPDSICEMMMTKNYADFYQHYPRISLKFSTAGIHYCQGGTSGFPDI